MKEFREERGKTIYVGDTASDMQMARMEESFLLP